MTPSSLQRKDNIYAIIFEATNQGNQKKIFRDFQKILKDSSKVISIWSQNCKFRTLVFARIFTGPRSSHTLGKIFVNYISTFPMIINLRNKIKFVMAINTVIVQNVHILKSLLKVEGWTFSGHFHKDLAEHHVREICQVSCFF